MTDVHGIHWRSNVPVEIRGHFTVNGGEKRRYGEHAAMRTAAKRGLATYRCSVCGWWHLATPKRTT